MRSCKKVLHISPTPLVGAPGKISNSLNKYTNIQSDTIILKDYPNHLGSIFIKDAIVFSNNSNPLLKELVTEKINSVDIIHVHNFLPSSFENYLIKNLKNKSVKFIYHVHSCTGEGPLFFKRTNSSKIKYDLLLAVSQLQPRLFQDHYFAPNIVLSKPNYQPCLDVPKIIFSPAHKKTGMRWGDKYSKNLNSALGCINETGKAKLIEILGVSPLELFETRKLVDITIDEINSGGFHQVSLEGLAAGNAVINGADWFSLEVIKNISKRNERPPFIIANENNIKNILVHHITNIDNLNRIKKESYEYFCENLKPDHLIKYYVKYYEHVLNLGAKTKTRNNLEL